MEVEMEIVEGGIYAYKTDWIRWCLFQVLKVDDEDQTVHIRPFKRIFWFVPPKAPDNNWQGSTGGYTVGHLPYSRAAFESWNPQLLRTEDVSEDDLWGYHE